MAKNIYSTPIVGLHTPNGLVEINLSIESIMLDDEEVLYGAFKTYPYPETVTFKRREDDREIYVDNDNYIYSDIIPYLKGERREIEDYELNLWFKDHSNMLDDIIILFAEAMVLGFLKYDPILIKFRELILKKK